MGSSRSWSGLLVVCVACAPTIGDDSDKSATDSSGTTDGLPDDTDTDSADPGDDTTSCGLDVALDQVFFTEGDTVSFTVACTDGPIEDGAVSVAGAGTGATFNPDTGVFHWDTDGQSGGRYDLTIGAAGGGRLESVVVPIWVADSPSAPNARDPRPLTYTEEWGLPVVHVEVGGTMTEAEQDATITVRDQQVEGFAKIRGASSTSYPKVSYTLDFESDELGVTEWGERTREHMVLITTFDDNSYVRQKLGYDLWAAMAEHQGVERLTPRTFFAVLYINGTYQGIYTACDRIDDEFLRHMGTSGEGSLYKSVSHDANFYLHDASGRTKSWLGAGYEKKEGDPDNWDDLYALVQHTGESDDDTLWNNHPGMDLTEFADWMLWAQFALVQDSAGKNAYLYADPDAERWRFAPWDLNESFGQNWYTLRLSATQRNDYYWNNRVFRMLQEHPEARELVIDRFTDLREDGPLQPAVLHSMIDDYLAILGPNIDRDWARWESEYQSFGRWAGDRNARGDWTTPAEEVAYIRAWIDDRMAMYDGAGPI